MPDIPRFYVVHVGSGRTYSAEHEAQIVKYQTDRNYVVIDTHKQKFYRYVMHYGGNDIQTL